MLHKFTMGCFHNATCAPWETRAACDVLGRLARRAGRRSVAGFVASLVGLAVVLLAPMRAAAQAPAAEDTLAAFSAVQHAVRAWGPIGEGEKVPGAAGACVTLKLRGEMIGRGIAWSGSASAPASGDTVVRDALAEAMKQAEPRLGAPNDAMREQAIREIARNVVVSVELAGPLSAIEPATWEEAESSLRPGLDGVAVRGAQGKGALHAVFPSQMMLTNELPHRALGGAVARCLGEGGAAAALDQPKKIREGHGIRMYSFRVGQAVQGSPTGGPVLLYRGGRLLAPNEILTTAQVRDMGAEAAQFLLRNGGPRAGNPDCPRGTLSQLLALYAVGRWTQAMHSAGLTVDTPLVRCAQDSARERPEAGAPAMRVLAALAEVPLWPPPGQGRALFWGSMRGMSRSVFAPQPDLPQVEERNNFDPAAIRIELRPLSVLAGIGLEGERGDPGVFEGTGRVLQAIHKEVAEARLVSMMPWLGWADVEQERATRAAGAAPNDIPFAIAYRAMRVECWKHQLTPATATEDTLDMMGGIVFTSGLGEGGGNPYPTWQCVRPLAFIATMLGDPRLTEPNERSREIASLMLAMRYLRQLQVDDASAWMYPDAELAKGGIRAAVWDSSQPVDATSLTLLCVVEFLKSLDELQHAAPASPSPAGVAPISTP